MRGSGFDLCPPRANGVRRRSGGEHRTAEALPLVLFAGEAPHGIRWSKKLLLASVNQGAERAYDTSTAATCISDAGSRAASVAPTGSKQTENRPESGREDFTIARHLLWSQLSLTTSNSSGYVHL